MRNTDFCGGGLKTPKASPSNTTTTSLTEALRAQGVSAISAERLASSHTPDLIGAWCEYKSRHENMGPGALVNSIKRGEMPPTPRRGRRSQFIPAPEPAR